MDNADSQAGATVARETDLTENDLAARCRQVRLLLLDVDGVMTDGSITYTSDGREIKTFHVRDGLGIKLWLEAGRMAGILSGRASDIVRRRAEELGVTLVLQGVSDKRAALARLLSDWRLTAAEVCFVGDDLPDVPVIASVGVGVAVADACEEARQAACYVTRSAGGRGAVREVAELLLRAQDRWAARSA